MYFKKIYKLAYIDYIDKMEERSDLLMEKPTITSSFAVWKLMKDISLLEPKRRTLTGLANELRVSRVHPYYNALMSYLIDKKIVVVTSFNERFNQKFIKINEPLLCKEIEDSVIWDEFASYVHAHKLIYARI